MFLTNVVDAYGLPRHGVRPLPVDRVAVAVEQAEGVVPVVGVERAFGVRWGRA